MDTDRVNWARIISQLVSHQDLTDLESSWAMQEILSNRADDAQIAAFLVGLRAKGERLQEISSLVSVILDKAISCDIPGEKLDIVGTGGDGHNTVNISTMSSIVAAAAGATVVKHGNRAVSSASGSADMLEALGVCLDMPSEQVVRSADIVGLTYCFAKIFHPSFKNVSAVRQALGIPTIFNILGPLANPSKATAYAIGVSRPHLLDQLAEVLAARGVRALVFMGDGGLDELCAFGKNHVREVREGTIVKHTFTASDIGLPGISLTDLKGAGAQENAAIARQILFRVWNDDSGRQSATEEKMPKDMQQAHRLRSIQETVVLNAAAGLVAYDVDELYASRPLIERLKDKMSVAWETIASGAAEQKLQQWVNFSHKRTSQIPSS